MKYYDPVEHAVVEWLDDGVAQPAWWGALEEREFDGTRRSFADGTDIQRVLDATSINALLECPRKYYYKLVLGRAGYEDGKSALYFGSAYHKCMELYYQMVAGGIFIDEPDVLLSRLAAYASLLGDRLVETTTYRNKETLIRAVVWRAWHYGVGTDDPLQPTRRIDGRAATEVSVRVPFIERDGVVFELSGHLDLVATDENDELWIVDYKSHKGALDGKWADSFTPGVQFPLYTMLAESLVGVEEALPKAPSGVIVDGLEVGVHFNRYRRYPLVFTESEQRELAKNIEWRIEELIRCAERDWWPMNQHACNGKFRPCEFKPVCSACPERREEAIEAMTYAKLWCPATER